MSETTPGGAGCALHPDTAALAVCDRCGAYMCSVCNEGGAAQLCPTCRERTGAGGFELTRDGWTLDSLFSRSWQAFVANIGQLVVGALIVMAITFAASIVREVLFAGLGRVPVVLIGVTVAGTFLQYAIQGVLQLGLVDMSFDALDGEPVRIETIFWHLAKVGKIVLQYLVAVAVMLVPLALFAGLVAVAVVFGKGPNADLVIGATVVAGLLALVPFVWVFLPLAFMQYELALDDDVGAIESIRRCFVLARGKRLALFGMTLLSGLIIMSGVILCGVGVVLTMPFGQVILASLFLALRNGSGLPPPVRRGKRARQPVVAAAMASGPVPAP